MSDYLQIKYRNSCDLVGSVFQEPETPFFYVMYLGRGADVGKPTYELIEEGREDGEKNPIMDFRKLTKKYEFTTVIPEYQLDCLASVMIHDTVYIRLKNGEQNRVYNFTVTPGGWTDNGNVVTVTISFVVRYDISTGCCGNEAIKYMPCLECTNITVTGWTNTLLFTPSSDRAIYMIGQTVGGEIVNNTLYQFRYRGRWHVLEYPVNTLICFTISSVDYRFYFDGEYWQPVQLVRSATALSATSVRVKGYMLPNTWAQLYKSTDDIVYTAVGTPISDGEMYNVGKTATGLTSATLYYFKFRMYNNNCAYGYSNTVQVTTP